MDTHWFLCRRVFKSSMISLFLLLILAPSSYCQQEEDYYSECSSQFNCGNLTDLPYPFWADGLRSKPCGLEGFSLRCNESAFPVITIESQEFYINAVDQPRVEMRITPIEFWNNTCPANNTYNYITLNTDLFTVTPNFSLRFPNLSLFYNCSNLSDSVSPRQRFTCSELDDAFYGYDGLRGEWMRETSKCSVTMDVPVQERFIGEEGLTYNLVGVLSDGFSIGYNKYNESCVRCRGSGGICGTDITNPNQFSCLCPDQPDPDSCSIPDPAGRDSNVRPRIVIIGSVAAVGTLLMFGFIICFFIRKNKRSLAPRKNQDFEAYLEKHGPLAVRRYSYSQVKKMTNSFREKLGQGGYGSVYKGALSEGRLVAVKMLNESKGEGEGFLNEVVSISKTSHVNIVTLLGFCLDHRKIALVYEFMPNGSLDKFICSKSSDQHLHWEMIHQIAIGIAQGLEYLHRGCNTRIVHFDIKPHNVLLDENLTPKISDFGLAKLCTRKQSKVSVVDARGTIGYIAPEVMYRHFGQVSYKSDVYSYGMMILEIVGGRNKQAEGNNSSEMYFPNWIYKSLELESKDEEILEEEDEIVRKLKMVGLWCIQTDPLERPTMSKVIEMLQASIQTLTIPPKPFQSSSATQFPLYSSTASTD